MRILFTVGAGALLLFTPLLLGDGSRPARELPARDGPEAPPKDVRKICGAGCSATPDDGESLSVDAFLDLVEAFADEPPTLDSPALEALLFHGDRARELLEEHGWGILDVEREELLHRELARDHAWLDVRIVDEAGVERMRLGRTRIPLGEKQHLHPEDTRRLPTPEVSGTVRRVGLHHLWTRL